MDERTPTLQIGDFSRLSRISVRMLRHYQERGLLEPAFIDPQTGYRYYTAAQLDHANRICQLRDVGLGIEQIKTALATFDDTERLRTLLTAHQAQLRTQQSELTARLDRLTQLLHVLEQPLMPTQVQELTLPAMTIGALRRILPNFSAEGELWPEFMQTLFAQGGKPLVGGNYGATFFDAEYSESDVDVEVWIEVAAPFTASDPLTCRLVPVQQIVTARLFGPYEGMSQISAALGTYIADHGLRTGPMFDIYRVSPTENPDPASWITDVCFPILDQTRDR